MIDTTTRWCLYIASFIAIGPIAGLLMELSDAPNGTAGTVLVTSSPVLGILGLLLGSILAAGIGVLAAWRCGLRPGLTCAGIVLLWMAGMSSGLTSIIASSEKGPWGVLVVEGVLVGLCLVGIGVAVSLAASWHRPSAKGAHAPLESEHALAFNKRSVAALAAAIPAGAVAAWALALADLKGQIIAAAVLAAVALTLLLRLIDLKTPALGAIGAGALLAIFGPAYALAQVPADDALAGAYAQLLPGIVLLTPLDWAAGVLLGAPLGLAWAASIAKRADG